MDNSTILSTQSLFLTLVSLLGAFFYVHLSDWRKDLIKLKAKWEQNRYRQTPEEKAAILEVRYELPSLSSYVTPLVTVVITVFILLLAALSCILWTHYSGPQVTKTLLLIAGGAFLILYVLLIGILLIGGMLTALQLQSKIAKEFTPRKTGD